MSITLQESINAAINLLPQHMDPIDRKIFMTLCSHIGHTDQRLNMLLRITGNVGVGGVTVNSFQADTWLENLALLFKQRGGPDLATKNLSMAFVREGNGLDFLVVIHTANPTNPMIFRTVEVIRARGDRDEDVATRLDAAISGKNTRL